MQLGNDTANFNLTTKTYRFCSPNGGKVPRGLDAIPCLRSINTSRDQQQARIRFRAACAITMQDFPHSDIRIDPLMSSSDIYTDYPWVLILKTKSA